MRRYLLVTGDPASIPAAVTRARALAADAGDASFVLITPRPRGIQNRQVAEHVASADEIIASAQFRQAGLRVERSVIGDASPVLAVEDELRLAPEAYEAVVLATRPPGPARMLGLDAHTRADGLPLPVVHVFAGHAGAIADPLIWRVRRRLALAGHPLASLVRAVDDRRLGTVLLLLPMLCYLSIGLGLALFVNRRFFITDAVALAIDAILVASLLMMERGERRRLRRRLLIEEGTDVHRGRRAASR
jgi:hypothetical protein